MALRSGLLSFELKHFEGLAYEPDLDHEFSHSDPAVGESIQPIVARAFAEIRKCVARSISSLFTFGQVYLQNVNNFMHLGTAVIEAEVQHADGTYGMTASMLSCRFYRLEPDSAYKVSLELEEMPSSAASADEVHCSRPTSGARLMDYGGGADRLGAHENGLDNDRLVALARALNDKFNLAEQVECLPVLHRGFTQRARFLSEPTATSSDLDLVLEYDFDKLIFSGSRAPSQDCLEEISAINQNTARATTDVHSAD